MMEDSSLIKVYDGTRLIDLIDISNESASKCSLDGFEKEVLHVFNEYKRLRGITDKLPRYADTGETFIPLFDDCWIISLPGEKWEFIEFRNVIEQDDLHCFYYNADAGWLVNWGGQWYGGTRDFYSTREAAEATTETPDER